MARIETLPQLVDLLRGPKVVLATASIYGPSMRSTYLRDHVREVSTELPFVHSTAGLVNGQRPFFDDRQKGEYYRHEVTERALDAHMPNCPQSLKDSILYPHYELERLAALLVVNEFVQTTDEKLTLGKFIDADSQRIFDDFKRGTVKLNADSPAVFSTHENYKMLFLSERKGISTKARRLTAAVFRKAIADPDGLIKGNARIYGASTFDPFVDALMNGAVKSDASINDLLLALERFDRVPKGNAVSFDAYVSAQALIAETVLHLKNTTEAQATPQYADVKVTYSKAVEFIDRVASVAGEIPYERSALAFALWLNPSQLARSAKMPQAVDLFLQITEAEDTRVDAVYLVTDMMRGSYILPTLAEWRKLLKSGLPFGVDSSLLETLIITKSGRRPNNHTDMLRRYLHTLRTGV